MSRVVALLLVLVATTAVADPYDFRIAKLGNPQGGGLNYDPRAEANFRVFARQMAAAMTSMNLAPPDTLGHSGFSISAEFSYIDFLGGGLPTIRDFQGSLLAWSVHARKGLPFGFELGARATWFQDTRMGAGSLELKWAISEGFLYFPDVAVRGIVSKLINGRDFDLTTGGFDLGVGKQFAIGGMVTLTPYVGWNLMFVGASSGSVDFNPGRTLTDSDTASEQFTNYFIFSTVNAGQNTHNRFYGGLRLIGGVVMVGGEFSYTLIGSFRDTITNEDRKVPGVLAVNVTLGLDF